MCFLLYKFPYQFFLFAVFMEHLKVRKNGGVAINGPPQDSMNGRFGHSWNYAFG